MYRVSTKISKKKFEGMLSGNKKYLPGDVSKALKDSGKGALLRKKSVHRDDALEAIKFLMKKGLISGTKSAAKLYQKAGKEQLEEEEKKKKEDEKKLEKKKLEEDDIKKARRQKNIRLGIAMDISDELTRKEMTEEIPGSPLSFKKGRLMTEYHEVKESKDKEKKPARPKKNLKAKPFDVNEITDLDIG
ncbi:MAG: hypothetical protein CMI53_01545 [Parcubacteria group bacterium]|nr:hypothetical protein [Parcubacteria group bacterium]|tara:strand:- start:10953 stop:11519 length:567 start_codon:yes stop_codon:yes gene_type:complete